MHAVDCILARRPTSGVCACVGGFEEIQNCGGQLVHNSSGQGKLEGRCRVGLEYATEKGVQEDELRRMRKAAELRGEDSQPWEATALPFQCDTCQHAFTSRQDITRHSYVTTHPKRQVTSRPPVSSM